MKQQQRRMSKAGIDVLIRWEGLELETYKDVAGYDTIGVGHLLKKSELYSGKVHLFDGSVIDIRHPITREQAIRILRDDLKRFRNAVNSRVKVAINQHQFDALVMFCFNVGVGAFEKSTLLKRLNAKRYSDVPNEFRKWTRSGGRVIRGLINRREAEVKLWEQQATSAANIADQSINPTPEKPDDIIALAEKLGLI